MDKQGTIKIARVIEALTVNAVTTKYTTSAIDLQQLEQFANQTKFVNRFASWNFFSALDIWMPAKLQAVEMQVQN